MTPARIRVTARLSLDPSEIEVAFIRAGGPGGQNVNKVASAVQLRFNAAASPSLDEPVRRRLIGLAGRRATKDGVIVITAQRHRTQERNRAEAVERLIDWVRRAAVVPKVRVPTKSTRSSKERRLKSKKRHSGIKSARSKSGWDLD